MQLVSRREQARAEREAAAAEGGEAPPPLVAWTPRARCGASAAAAATAEEGAAARRGAAGVVPTLQSLAVSFLVQHIDSVASFGVLPPAALHAIAAGLCARRALTEEVLPLFTAEDAGVSELLLPDCHLLGAEALGDALRRLTAVAPEQLTVVDLGYCGQGFTPEVAALLQPCRNLHTLRLTGCYRLSTAALVALCEVRGAALRVLHVAGNSQLTEPALAAVGAHCIGLESLAVEDCAQLPAEGLLPLRRLVQLRCLSLCGLCMASDAAVSEAVAGSAPTLEALHLKGCALLTDATVFGVAHQCPRLRELDLSGLELLTDAAALNLAQASLGLHKLLLKRCVQLSDEAVVGLAAACRGTLRVVSLNNVPALSDLSLQALAEHCAASLEDLDVSWCRGVTDDGVGLLADSCTQLRRLSIWGCSQLTPRFFRGYSNAQLRILGRGPTQ
eukprot:Transcript_8630.p1 GENE.Transcript_8630~~Transcript_8630.p1  ORF type:complete len:446 (+),score=168.75 Transcript_8630:1467-2804(+)